MFETLFSSLLSTPMKKTWMKTQVNISAEPTKMPFCLQTPSCLSTAISYKNALPEALLTLFADCGAQGLSDLIKLFFSPDPDRVVLISGGKSCFSKEAGQNWEEILNSVFLHWPWKIKRICKWKLQSSFCSLQVISETNSTLELAGNRKVTRWSQSHLQHFPRRSRCYSRIRHIPCNASTRRLESCVLPPHRGLERNATETKGRS